MRMKCTLAAAVLVVCGMACGAQAYTLYEQTFAVPAPPQSGTILPWSINMIGGYEGTYSGSFDPMGLRDADTNAPINGNTGVYTGNGGGNPIVNEARAFYTIDGQAGFSAFNPTTCPGCTFNIYANTQGGGADDHGYFAILAGGAGSRDPVAWYIASTSMATPTQNQGALLNLRSLLYNPAAGNWNNLTIDPNNVVAPVIGGPAGSLAGLVIKGVGVVQVVNNPANDFSSWNYADYFITCVPEPGTLALLAIGMTFVLAVRRREK